MYSHLKLGHPGSKSQEKWVKSEIFAWFENGYKWDVLNFKHTHKMILSSRI